MSHGASTPRCPKQRYLPALTLRLVVLLALPLPGALREAFPLRCTTPYAPFRFFLPAPNSLLHSFYPSLIGSFVLALFLILLHLHAPASFLLVVVLMCKLVVLSCWLLQLLPLWIVVVVGLLPENNGAFLRSPTCGASPAPRELVTRLETYAPSTGVAGPRAPSVPVLFGIELEGYAPSTGVA